MRVYADTSVLVAWFHPADHFAQSVTAWCRGKAVEFVWNPFLRIELRHNLRRLSGEYATVAWHAYRASETSNRLRMEVQRPLDLLEQGDELSARHASGISVGSWDCVHVAAARQSRTEVFLTCDVAQAELARSVKLPRVQLFK
jgi:predicted nucleic acid-binding protein